ncbi:MAG TPA: hypothetical protein VFJ16_00240 [Longimicrobium sp.]|nr:hypothetical protein [Longimicrobium sp.]
MPSRRTIKKPTRWTPEEWRHIEEAARARGVPPLRYVREAALAAKLPPRVRRRGSHELVKQLMRLLNNLHQLERVAEAEAAHRAVEAIRATGPQATVWTCLTTRCLSPAPRATGWHSPEHHLVPSPRYISRGRPRASTRRPTSALDGRGDAGGAGAEPRAPHRPRRPPAPREGAGGAAPRLPLALTESKNLLGAVEALRGVEGTIVFDVYGTIEREEYLER